MKLLTLLFTAFIGAELASACCDPKSMWTCCGKGKCNVFCCNCDNGCDSTCKPWRGPIRVPGRRPIPGPPPLNTLSTPALLSLSQINPLSRLQGDQETLDKVDVEGKGYFTYEEFIGYLGVEDGAGWRGKFGLFDRDGDGRITVHEMRLPEGVEESDFVEHVDFEVSGQEVLGRQDLK